jgi:hypothetical protein
MATETVTPTAGTADVVRQQITTSDAQIQRLIKPVRVVEVMHRPAFQGLTTRDGRMRDLLNTKLALVAGGGPNTRVPATAEWAWAQYELIDAAELAERLAVPKSWVDERVRNRTTEKIPHLKFGKYVRFAWGSPALADWLRQRMVVSNSTVKRA